MIVGLFFFGGPRGANTFLGCEDDPPLRAPVLFRMRKGLLVGISVVALEATDPSLAAECGLVDTIDGLRVGWSIARRFDKGSSDSASEASRDSFRLSLPKGTFEDPDAFCAESTLRILSYDVSA